jgi:hypothetical protein
MRFGLCLRHLQGVLHRCLQNIKMRPALIDSKITVFAQRIKLVNKYNNISYQFSNDVEFKLAKFLQLIGTVKRTIFKKVRTETILKIYNTLVLPTFLYGSENWTLTATQRLIFEA